MIPQKENMALDWKIKFEGFIKYWMYLSTLKRRPNNIFVGQNFPSQQIVANMQGKEQYQWIFNSQSTVSLWNRRNPDSRPSFAHIHCISNGQPSKAGLSSFTPHIYFHTEVKWVWSKCIYNQSKVVPKEPNLSQSEWGEVQWTKGDVLKRTLHVCRRDKCSRLLALVLFLPYRKRKKVKPVVSYLQEMPIALLPLHYRCACPIAHHSPPPQSNKHKHRKISWRTLFLKQKPHHQLLAWHSYIIIYIYCRLVFVSKCVV